MDPTLAAFLSLSVVIVAIIAIVAIVFGQKDIVREALRVIRAITGTTIKESSKDQDKQQDSQNEAIEPKQA